MRPNPERALRRLAAALATVLALTSCAPRQEPYQPALDAWGMQGIEQAAPKLLANSSACLVPTSPRYYELLGADYRLSLGGGEAPIIGRGHWGAGPVITEGRSWDAYPQESSVCSWIHRITVHHTHTPLTIQGLQKFHQTMEDPKADIAYHFFIDTDGLIYEARPLGFKGSHSEVDNSNNVGVVLNGDFTERKPGPRQLASLKTLLEALRCPCAPMNGLWVHQQRQGLLFPGVPGHYTACPGTHLAAEVYGLAGELGYGPISRYHEAR